MTSRSTPKLSGFSLQEMLVVIAIIGIVTLIVLPAISGLTQSAEEASAKRNAQMLASVAAAAQAAGDPAMRTIKSKPALLAYLGSGLSTTGSGGVARVGYAGLDAEETMNASRYLTYNPQSRALSFTGGSRVNPVTDAPEDGTEDPPDPTEQRDKWNARLLEGAANAAISSGDTTIPTAGSKSAAITYLVDGGVGGTVVANLTNEEKDGAASYLQYANGTLVFEED